MATYSDAFTDTNNTLLSAHTPTGGGFTWSRWAAVSVDNLLIDTNQVAPSGSSGGSAYLASITPTDADYRHSLTLNSGSHASLALLSRVNTGSVNFIGFGWSSANSRWELSEYVGGSPTLRASSTSLAPTSTARTIELQVEGTAARGYVDGTLVCSGTIATVTAAGQAAISAPASTAPRGDNWSYDDALPGASTKAPPLRMRPPALRGAYRHH